MTEAVFALTVLVMCVVALVRNELVYRIRMRRIGEISAKCTSELGRADFIPVMEARYAELDTPNHHVMVIDLTKWTYRQFYPEGVK
jgi:hypothetical protein